MLPPPPETPKSRLSPFPSIRLFPSSSSPSNLSSQKGFVFLFSNYHHPRRSLLYIVDTDPPPDKIFFRPLLPTLFVPRLARDPQPLSRLIVEQGSFASDLFRSTPTHIRCINVDALTYKPFAIAILPSKGSSELGALYNTRFRQFQALAAAGLSPFHPTRCPVLSPQLPHRLNPSRQDEGSQL